MCMYIGCGLWSNLYGRMFSTGLEFFWSALHGRLKLINNGGSRYLELWNIAVLNSAQHSASWTIWRKLLIHSRRKREGTTWLVWPYMQPSICIHIVFVTSLCLFLKYFLTFLFCNTRICYILNPHFASILSGTVHTPAHSRGSWRQFSLTCYQVLAGIISKKSDYSAFDVTKCHMPILINISKRIYPLQFDNTKIFGSEVGEEGRWQSGN